MRRNDWHPKMSELEEVDCPFCMGKGYIEYKCDVCYGIGYWMDWPEDAFDNCHGDGTLTNECCPCRGEGKMPLWQLRDIDYEHG